jgi:hypothetical protein
MVNYIKKEFAEKNSPTPSLDWLNKNENDRILEIFNFIKNHATYSYFEVVRTFDNGQVILRTEHSFLASERGTILLNLEKIIKENIDKSITIWLEPVGDKSKLRSLRGMEIQ